MPGSKNTTETDLVVVKLTSARLALSQAKTIQDAKSIIDIASALEVYAKRQQLGQEAVDYAHAIKIEALRRVGELLQATDRNTGAAGVGTNQYEVRSLVSTAPPTLAELGIDKKLSSLAQKLADLPPEQFAQVAEGAISVSKAIQEVREAAVTTNLIATEIPAGKHRVLYVDPPWFYSTPQHSTKEQDTVIGSHYPSMKTEAICALPIRDMAAANAVLFLWATSPLLFESKQVIDAWNFTYKASIIWDKVKHNVGHYVSVRHEFLLICTRGSCRPDAGVLFDSVVSIERTTHSTKPDHFRTMIDQMYLPIPNDRIELFARGPVPSHWHSWGNQ